ncbi:hypothetical protein BLD48_05715 [Exiguobacterium sp. KRL4]|uniref:DUF2634 domain-containing protein n=1 Tax=Exiguobacterium sp. KRL4 TaxID=1914536 RepID=UPI0008F9269C|nr:DUF2634 domain-containing protein [Exiguobacterium sp. KRL4]OIN67387.1 hypothetical protein BLD48_05715 [Exiguobacterium sp. KRL4]
MAFTPQESFNDDFDEFEADAVEAEETITIAPSQTWRIDFANGRLTPAIIDGKDAVMQMAAIVVQTQRGRHYIYDEDFGVGADEIISANLPTAIAMDEMSQEVAEALEQDDRVDSVISVAVDIVDGVATVDPVIELVEDGTESEFEGEVD